MTGNRIPGTSSVSGSLATSHGDDTYTDQWNVRYGLDPSLSVDHIVDPPFPDASVPGRYDWPDPAGSVKRAVRRYIDVRGKDSGLVLSTTNDAMTDIPLENLPAAYEEARNYSAELYSGS